jgi:PTH1 family peptidyl-tRNA hydrolase
MHSVYVGSNYERTRHNVGFMVIDELARAENIECRKLEKSAAVGRGEIGGRQVLLVKPVTFMNNSGESVSALARFYKVRAQELHVGSCTGCSSGISAIL